MVGLGVISPSGNDIKTFWENIKGGVNCITLVDEFPTDDYPSKVIGRVKDFDPLAYGIEKGQARKQSKFILFALAAAAQATAQSGLVSGENIDPMRYGVYIGSGVGGFESIANAVRTLDNEGPRWVSPLFVPTAIANMASGNVAIKHGACGPCCTVLSACSTATHSIGEAYRAIKHGYADAIIAGGAEATEPKLGIAGFGNARTLTHSTDPEKASRPFSADRDGFVLGEGAGVIVLEEYEHAKARGANILAEICGYGNTCDAYNATAPRPDGLTQAAAIKAALDEANYSSEDVLYINAHGTSTKLNDQVETLAFKNALGEDAYKAHISSIKSMMGHGLGAAGGIEAITCILALQEGIVPPTINLDNPAPECDLDYTPNKAVEADLTIAISDSLGFGGHNGCIAFRKYNE